MKEKTKSIKEKKETIKEVVAEVKSPEGKYHLIMKFNDKIVDKTTDDLFNSIREEDPGYLKTKIIFNISTKEGSCERLVFIHKGKMMFKNDIFLNTFINHLIFKPIYNG